LNIELTQDGTAVSRIATVTEGEDNLKIPLEGTLGEPVRLALRAEVAAPANGSEGSVNEDLPSPEAGFLLIEPQVVQTGNHEPDQEGSQVSQLEGDRSGNSKLPNVLIYLVDTLRPDHLGCYGYERDISPSIDSFAADGILFEEVIGQSSWTRPAVATLFTGLWPGTHGTNRSREKLSSDAVTLAEVLTGVGYRSAAFISNPNVSAAFGFRQGFEEFFQIQGRPKVRSDIMTDRIRTWLQGQSLEEPLFIYAHTADPHNPYLAPEEYRQIHAPNSGREVAEITANIRKQNWEPTEEVLASLRDLYDAEIAFNDDSFGELLNTLHHHSIYEDTLIIFVSDHGEEFHEHGAWTHGKNLYTETLNVPLIARFPGISKGQRISDPVQQADLFPTILAYLGIEFSQASLDGRNILALIDPTDSGEPAAGEPLFSYLHRYGDPSVSVVFEGWKVIQRRSTTRNPVTQLYDLSRDAQEIHDLAHAQPIRTAFLTSLIERKLASNSHRLSSDEAEIDSELEQSLQALGYL
jgi:arylsulfatase A-like enzyme